VSIPVAVVDAVVLGEGCWGVAELVEGVLGDILGMEALQYNNYIKHME
jgi:hypothetical protein